MKTTGDIKAALRTLFSQPHYATFFEVKDGAGFNTKRSADAIIMSLWPSRGLTLKGIEIKISRGDWLRELKDPAKAESIARYCDEWWIVTGQNVIKHTVELPETWGWMEFGPKGLVVQKPAKKMEPAPIDRPFLAALLRRADEVDAQILENMIETRTRNKIDEMKASHERSIEERVLQRTQAYNRLKEAVEAFEAETGLSIAEKSQWNWLGPATETARALNVLRQSGAVGTYGGLRQLGEDLRKHAAQIEAALATLGVPPKVPAEAKL